MGRRSGQRPPYIAEIDDVEILGAWTVGPSRLPRWIRMPCARLGHNVIRINNNYATSTMTLEGDTTGTEGAPSHFMGRIVVVDEQRTCSALGWRPQRHRHGSPATDSEVYLVIISVPDQFSSYQRYGYRI